MVAGLLAGVGAELHLLAGLLAMQAFLDLLPGQSFPVVWRAVDVSEKLFPLLLRRGAAGRRAFHCFMVSFRAWGLKSDGQGGADLGMGFEDEGNDKVENEVNEGA